MKRRRRFMKKRKGLLKKAIAGVMALALCASGMSTSLAAPAGYTDHVNVPNPSRYIYDSTDPLYAATHFHIFAEESASISAHCNGNIATALMKHSINSGSNKVYGEELTYIRQLEPGFNGTFGNNTKVVFGAETDVYLMNNADPFATCVGSADLGKVNYNKNMIYTEASAANRYIDLEGEFNKLSRLSANVAKEPTSTGVTLNNNVVNLSSAPKETLYLNIKAEDLMGNEFIVEGTSFKENQALVINVDLGDRTSYELPFTRVLLRDAKEGAFGTGEDKGTYTGHGNLLWNFYSSTGGNVTTYTGEVKTCTEFKGTVLAPDAVISSAASNQDGNFIGRQVHLGGGETHRWDFGGTLKNYDQYGMLNVKVTDETDTLVDGVVVQIYDSKNEPIAELITGEGGTSGFTSDLNNLVAGDTYTAKITQVPYGYDIPAINSASEVIVANDTVTIPFELVKDIQELPPVDTGYVQVIVTEVFEDNSEKPVESVAIAVTNTQDPATTEAYATDGFGKAVSQEWSIGTTCTATMTLPSGYEYVSGYNGTGAAIIDATSPEVIEFKIKKIPQVVNTGSVQVVVVAVEDGKERPIEGAVVTIADNQNHVIKELIVVTDVNGQTEIVKDLPLNNPYTTTITGIPEGFELANPSTEIQTATPIDENTVVIKYVLAQEKGSLDTKVTDKDGNAVKGVEVEIYDNAGTYVGTYITGSDGLTTELYNLTADDKYTAKIIYVPDGYQLPADSDSEIIVAGKKVQIDFVLEKEPTGDLIVTISKNDATKAPIQGATIVVTDQNGTVVKTETTNETGKFEIEGLKPGEYTVTTVTVPSPYTDAEKPLPQTAVVVANKESQVDLLVPRDNTTVDTGKLEVTIKDKDTGNPIPNAKVDIIDKTTGDVIKDNVETDKDGFISVDKLPGGDYIIDVEEVPGGYNPPEKEETTVYIGQTIREELVVDITPGSMEVVIVDKNDPTTPIPNATVEILNPDGTVKETVQTNGEGKTPVIENLEVGKTYTVHVKEVPGDYEAPDDKKVPIETPQKVEVKLEVGLETTTTPTPETGKMQVVITDKNDPTKPIPGATVVIKNPDGSVVKTVVTDENGLTPVIDKLTVGTTYTIETTDVPDGYSTPTPTTQKITGTELVKVPLVVGRDSGVTSAVGSLYVIITDKNTGKPIPGATVEVSNSAGEKIKTVVTDDTGAFTVTDLKPDTYTVKTTKVPAGYTAPDPQSAAVKSNARTDVHLYVAKGTTTTTDTVVQTGDDSNVQAASILALMACIGIVVVSIMRKREEI